MEYKKIDSEKQEYIKFEFKIEKEKLNEAEKEVYNKYKNKIAIPGFRKGHAPINIIKKYYGDDVFTNDALDKVIPENLEEIGKKENIISLAMPKVDIKDIDESGNINVEATFITYPEVSIDNYKGIEITNYDTHATDEDVQLALKDEQEKNSTLVDIDDRPAKMGDVTNINFEGYSGDEKFEGGSAEDFELTLGSGQFIPGFEDQVVGMKIGDTKDINVTFPKEYHVADLAGKPAKFVVTLNGISEKELPELDDEFAKDVSEFDTLEEYKKSLKEEITKHNEEHLKQHQLEDVKKYLIENVKTEVPEEIVDYRLNIELDNLSRQMQRYGIKLDQFVQMSGQTMDSFMETEKNVVTGNIKADFAIRYIADKEKIEITDEMVDEEIAKIKEANNIVNDSAVSDDVKEHIKNQLKETKTMEFLIDNAKKSKKHTHKEEK